jgi:2'-5' RNA ligase
MAEQTSLFGHDLPAGPSKPSPERPATDRLFFTIFPDAETAAVIAHLAQGLRDRHGLRGRPLATDRFHITLKLVGNYVDGLPREVVAAAMEAGETMAAAPFEVTFDRAASFGGNPSNRPFVLLGGDRLAALKAFQETLVTALAKARLKLARSAFTPHVTLLYDGQLVLEQPIQPITWTAHEFVLVHSLLGQTRHIPLGRWPLRA